MMRENITIAGQTYRVEVNWNTIVSYLEATGKNDVSSLVNFGQLKPTDLAGLLAAAINEGERLEGREAHFTALDMGAMCGVREMAEFITIFTRQSSVMTGDRGEKKKE